MPPRPVPAAPPPADAALADVALVDAALAEDASGATLLDPTRADRALPSAVRRYARRATDWFLPEQLREEGPDARRRARFVVLTALMALPFVGVLLHQLLATGQPKLAALAGATALIVLACPALLRLTRSVRVSAGALVGVMTASVFVQAFGDAGIDDPILHWAAFLPLIGALLGGVRFALVSAAVNAFGIGALYALTARGHAFPRVTDADGLLLAQLLSLATATVFGLVWGWLYEGFTLREGRRTNAHLLRLRSALTASEARYRGLFDNAPVGLYRTSPDGRVLLANPTMVRMLGYDSAEALLAEDGGADVYADAGMRDRFRAALEADGEVDGLTSVWKARDGRLLHVVEHARIVREADGPGGGRGPTLYYEGAVRDVTAQVEGERRSQATLRQSEERFRALVQHASDLTLVLDGGGRVAYASPAATRLLGVPPEALVGRSPYGRAHPDDRRRLALLARRVLRRPGSFGPLAFRVVHADGHYLYVELVGSNLLQNPHVRGLVLNVRDVTERKRAEAVLVRSKEQAEEVARLKSAFLANMSHEIRTPLTGILGFASILADEVQDEQHREFVALIEKSGRRLLDTLNSVLDLARLEAGRVALGAAPVAVAEAAEEVVTLLRPVARARGLTLEVRLVAPAVTARLDRSALDRVLTNLVGNAIKFTERGGITVEVDADATSARLRVTDTGVGIDPEFLPRLFEEFEQESTGIARSHEGSGLGLAITRQLVERMRGAIEVDTCKGEGGGRPSGTTFTVSFPRADVAPPAAPPSVLIARPAAPAARGVHRLLVLDDNANTRLLMERMLRAEYAVTTAATAQEALSAAESAAGRGAPFEAALLDINLGGPTSGEDVMRRLRRLPAYAATPVLAFTAYALPGDAERFLHAGFDGYLAKPFTKGQLLEALTQALAPSGDGAPHAPPLTA